MMLAIVMYCEMMSPCSVKHPFVVWNGAAQLGVDQGCQHARASTQIRLLLADVDAVPHGCMQTDAYAHPPCFYSCCWNHS
jgi:hypothetical protein